MPETLGRRGFFGVGEVLIVGFEETPVELQSWLGPGAIGSEENAIGVAFEEALGRERLAAEFADSRGKFEVEVWMLLEPGFALVEIFAVVSEVRGNELGVGVSSDQAASGSMERVAARERG